MTKDELIAKKCDHVIGYEYANGGGGFIYKSNRKDVEGRGYHTLEYFDYCHDCGKKINKPKDE